MKIAKTVVIGPNLTDSLIQKYSMICWQIFSFCSIFKYRSKNNAYQSPTGFHQQFQQWEKSVACVSVPLMGEKLPYYCRVKKILAAVKNGPKLARPVVKSALEKLSLCLKTVF